MPLETHQKLALDIGRLLDKHSTDDVIPVLITLSARALLDDAGGNMLAMEARYERFCELLQDDMKIMLAFEVAEASEATKQ